MYHDEQRNLGKYPYVPKTFQVRMSCKDFVNQLRTHIKTGKLKIYMQQSLTKECSGAKIVKDFQACNNSLFFFSPNLLNDFS